MKEIEVVAAIIVDNKKFFATQRGYGEFKDKWEFPGGKIEKGETREEALCREIKEELDIEISIENFLETIEYDYSDFHLTMHCYICKIRNGKIILKEHEDAKWILREEFKEIDWLPADLKLIQKSMISNELLKTKEYDFLRNNEHLGKNIILIGLGGSYSYGTNNAKSDIDIRGITLNRKSDLIGMTEFEQYIDNYTDTCIYGFNKMIKLLLNCNPNTIELLGLKNEHYLYVNEIGKELIDNKKMFLSKRAIRSFGGYASTQLRRMQNALARDSYPQVEKEEHILNLNKHAMHLIRIFMMAIDILEKEEINTYRREEQKLLQSIRNGEFQKEDGTFNNEFYELITDYENKLKYASKNTNLPDEPNRKRVEEFVMSVNERVIKD